MKPSQQFKAWLDKTISAAKPGYFLPTDASLSRKWGISLSTLARIYKDYTASGKLSRIPGKGTCIPSVHSPSPDSGFSVSSQESIVTYFKRSFSRGTLKTGDSLPQQKLISMQFHVTPATVGSAYRQLEHEGFVVRIGRRYWVGDFQKMAANRLSSRVFVIACGNTELDSVFSGNLFSESFMKMERTLISCGFNLHIDRFQSVKSLIPDFALHDRYPQGMLFVGISEDEYLRLLKLAQRYLFKSRRLRRTSLVLTGQNFKRMSLDKRFRKIATGGPATMVARETARFLSSHGRDRAALFFDTRKLSSKEFYNYLRIFTEMRNRSDQCETCYFIVSPQLSRDRDSLKAWLSETTGDLVWAQLLLSKYRPMEIDEFLPALHVVPGREKAFEAARDYDVWLFPRDEEAAAALDWCRRRGVAIPAERWIIGFENSPRYLHRAITSCVPDWETIGYLMAHALIGDIPLEKSRQGNIRTRAAVFERLTTG